ncbi:S-adenosyl-L-methionine-dependent methyltransferase [Desarmillaria tabescens]|uniref:S-adenosyl-L-methionine-dependent methyltransferase n=1 Tax=Armillaria tabescens TaxID=1929756 RepID=A0AA39MLJ9_ARMTA|nr:S-adenosyl-L-methionine-dependent methyltransferase [Desarmillaria tabescens]KAK0438348.1 S-adenosyl-L-methionine-dependent methyltransferase [Desarmillaria tabescens]
MGRNKNKDGRGGGGRRQKKDEYRSDLIDKSDMKNERFFAYYKAQKIVPDDEWDLFVETLRQHLPTTFRVAGSRETAHTLNSMVKDIHVPTLSNVTFEGQSIPPPVQILWYPEGLAWQFNVPKKVLRKSSEFKKFHSFLVGETEVGNISRQEAVSMLPPLFLGVEPHHHVMDMCAAPGSKTAQLLEALHANDTVTSTSMPSGLLIANDSDYKRTHLLIHQSARLPSPALMVTNMDASNYPSIKIPAPVKRDASAGVPPRTEQLLFDRVLCDVPCSGDGTIRKNIGIWKKWQPQDGNGLHSLQLRILQRAMKLLKSDGRIVYSTCSLNPVENEAVVASALRSHADFHLVDVSSQLPELKRQPGLTSWRPTSDREAKTTYDTYDAFLSAEPGSETKLTPGHWPPQDVDGLNLPRCMRIYPHLQDSGGFFVAVLERRSTNKAKKRTADSLEDVPESKKPRLAGDDAQPPAAVEEAAETKASDEAPMDIVADEKDEKASKAASGSGGSFKENPYTFLRPDDPILLSCIERLHLTSEFPASNVLVRNPEGDAVRSMYLTNDIVKQVVLHNEYGRIRLNAAGTKVLAKQEAGKGVDAQFRILGEGLPVVLPFTDPATILDGNLQTLRILVQSYYPLCSSFSEPFKSIIEGKPAGSHIIRFPPEKSEGATLFHDVVLPVWKSNVSISLMIDKKAKSALSLRIFGADITTAGREASSAKVSKEDTATKVEETQSSAKDETPEDSEETALEEAMEAVDN